MLLPHLPRSCQNKLNVYARVQNILFYNLLSTSVSYFDYVLSSNQPLLLLSHPFFCALIFKKFQELKLCRKRYFVILKMSSNLLRCEVKEGQRNLLYIFTLSLQKTMCQILFGIFNIFSSYYSFKDIFTKEVNDI